MGKNILIKSQHYPIIIISTKGELNEDDVDQFDKELREFLENTTGEYIIISDQTEGRFLSGAVRIKLGKTLKSISEKYKEREYGVIIIQKSFIGKAMMTGLMLIVNPGKNFYVVSNLDEAIKRAMELKKDVENHSLNAH